MAIKTARSELLTMRLRPDNLAAATMVAAVTGRSTGALIEYALELYLRKNYPLAYHPGAKITLSLAEAPQDAQEASVAAAPESSISLIELTVRAEHCLKSEGINTIERLVTWSRPQLLKVQNLGRASLNDIEAALSRHGLALAPDSKATCQTSFSKT